MTEIIILKKYNFKIQLFNINLFNVKINPNKFYFNKYIIVKLFDFGN